MSEEMPYIQYEGEGDWKKRFEMTIPILLLILVIIVIGAKLQWFNVPVISDWFGKGSTDIAIIGYDASLIKAIETDIRKDLPINIYPLNKSDLYGIRDPAVFAKYDMVILTEGQDGDTIELDGVVLDYLSSFVASGKPAIVIGLAGSKITDSPQASGWIRMGFVPARCKTARCSNVSVTYDRITMFVRDVNHPMLKEFVEPLTFDNSGQKTITYSMVNPSEGTSILDMEVETGAQTYVGTAIVERTATGGKVLYFAFQPSLYPPLLENALEYLR